MPSGVPTPERVKSLENQAVALAERLPDLLVAARRVAHTVTFGIHGRRRAGHGETFWQFRHYQDNDSAAMVDWRRSASSDHLYVRESEWEAAHTVWLWSDLSPSMAFRSHLSQTTKGDRALILMFAIADLLLRGGERVGLLAMTRPLTHRTAVERLARRLVERAAMAEFATSLPPKARLSRFSECVLIGDLLEPIDEISARVEGLASGGVRGHMVQILDPAEETLPYRGRVEFQALEGRDSLLAEHVDDLRPAYQQKFHQHREALRDLAQRVEWSFMTHHTDRSAGEALLALHGRLAGSEGDYRSNPATFSQDGPRDPGAIEGGR